VCQAYTDPRVQLLVTIEAQLNQLRERDDAVELALYCLEHSSSAEVQWFQCNILEHVLTNRSAYWNALPATVQYQVRLALSHALSEPPYVLWLPLSYKRCFVL
jgi:hypothetical protein